VIYWIFFLIYSSLVISIGFYIFLRDKKSGKIYDNQSYWAADKKVSGWSTGLSISASMMSISWSCVYGVQLFYWYGTGGIWLLIIPWLITMFGFYTLTPLFRKLNVFSQPELMEKRFNRKTRQLLAPALIIVFTTWAGAEIYAAGITIAPFLKISVPITLFLIALIVIFYSFTGGFSAVILTDRIQFLLVAIFIFTMAVIGISETIQDFDLASFLSQISQPPKMHKGVPILFSPGLALIFITLFAYLPGWLVETDVWIRIQAARNLREARKGILIASFNSFLFVGLLPLLIGLCALYLYPPVNGEIPARLNDGALIFSVFMQDFTSPFLSAILGVGLIGAAMSTIDTCGNVVALSLSYDLIEPFLQKYLSKENLNILARWLSILAIFMAFIYALFTESLWDIFYLSSGILTTTIFLPVIMAFRPTTSTKQVQFSIILGFSGTIIFYFLESKNILINIEPAWLSNTGLGYILWGFFCGLLGLFIGKPKLFSK
jgi:SSS family solute:Na+ symporter